MSARAAGPDIEEVASASRLLIGRDRELAELYALVDGIEEQGGALVVRGEAGIGKSALLAAAKERAQHRGITVVSTTGALSEARLAFAGLHQLLRPLLGGLDSRNAIDTVDPTPYFVKYGENFWAALKGYLDECAATTAAPVIEKYTGVLAAADVFTEDV